ncbi:MAG: response regulator transcription factor [bacterium]|nr:response regulator transcription factor [bacterium]
MIVSDVRLYREGLTQVLNQDGRLGVVSSAESAALAIEQVERYEPESVLLDTAIPKALETISTIARQAPQTKVIALGLSESEEEVVACAEAGIAGYVCREGSVDDLVRAVQDAVRERFGCSRRIAAALVRRVRHLTAQRNSVHAKLTPREYEIAELLDQGLTNKQISSRLFIEVATVKTHVHNILEKLGARSRGEAASKIRGMNRPRFGREMRTRLGSTI